jgi:hypothetical protein
VRRRRDTLSIVQIFEASQRYKPTGMTGYNPVPSSKTEHSGKDLSGEVGGCPVSPCGGISESSENNSQKTCDHG